MSITNIRTGDKSSTHLSLYKGVVTDPNYDKKQGMIKVIVPELTNSEIIAKPVMYGKSMFIPEKGSAVLIYANSNLPNDLYYIGVLPVIDEDNKLTDITNVTSNIKELKDDNYTQDEVHIIYKTPYISEHWKTNSVNDTIENVATSSLKSETNLPKKDIRVTKIRKTSSVIEVDNQSVLIKDNIVPVQGSNTVTEEIAVDGSNCKDVLELKAGSNTITIIFDSSTGVIELKINNTYIKAVNNEISLFGGNGNLTGVVTQECICPFTGQPHSCYSKNVKATKG